MDLKESTLISEDIDNHWYYSSKANALVDYVGKVNHMSALDIGSGSGFFSKFLLRNTDLRVVWCYDINYHESQDVDYLGKKIYFRKSIGEISVDLILLMDVLEHIDDDLEFLKNYVSRSKKGTKFLISVPAFMFLWSQHDVFLEHKRRYRIKNLNLLVEASGLEIVKSTYFFSLVFPIAVFIRIISKIFKLSKADIKSDLKKHSKLTNRLLKVLCYFDRRYIFAHNRFAGLSIFCLAEKK